MLNFVIAKLKTAITFELCKLKVPCGVFYRYHYEAMFWWAGNISVCTISGSTQVHAQAYRWQIGIDGIIFVAFWELDTDTDLFSVLYYPHKYTIIISITQFYSFIFYYIQTERTIWYMLHYFDYSSICSEIRLIHPFWYIISLKILFMCFQNISLC